MTWPGILSQKAAISAAGRWVAVGLLGLQTISSWVAAVTSAAIASRSWTSPSASGTRISRAPESAARYGYIENEGHA